MAWGCKLNSPSPPPAHGAISPNEPGTPNYFTNTVRCTTPGRIPLDEWSAQHTELYLTIHNTHTRQTSKQPTGFEPIIPESERPQTHTLDRAATGSGKLGSSRSGYGLVSDSCEHNNEPSGSVTRRVFIFETSAFLFSTRPLLEWSSIPLHTSHIQTSFKLKLSAPNRLLSYAVVLEVYSKKFIKVDF